MKIGTKSRIGISHLLSTTTVIVFLIIWQIYSIQVNNPHLMPDPINVFGELFKLLGEGHTYIVILNTFKRLFLSLGVAILLGTVLGLASGVHYQVEAIMKPIVVTLRTIPVISIVVVMLILYGNTWSLYIISFLLLFPIIYQSEHDGIKNIDPLLLDVLQLECNECNLNAVRMVFFPLALPHLRTGIIQSAGLGLKVLVIAEYIAQTSLSIGRELYISRINLQYDRAFAWSIILIIFVLIIEHFVERRLRYSTR